MCLPKDKIQDLNRPAILFELIPPQAGLNSEDYKTYAECVVDVILHAAVPVDTINIPEIREEAREGVRTYSYLPKGDPRELGTTIKEICNGQLSVAVNRCTVYDDLASQIQWLEETGKQYHLQNIILVGGDCSTRDYPGPSVNDFAKYIKQHYPEQFICGGIAIPTRRHSEPELDEPMRMVQKIKAGIEYFTTQIIYEADSINQLLLDYHTLCIKENITPRRVVMSFAPISNDKDLQFMEWLGVVIPEHVKTNLFKSNIAIGWRSLMHCLQVLKQILTFVKQHNLKVPLGLNIEHINLHNFMLSKQFIDELGKVYIQFTEENRC